MFHDQSPASKTFSISLLTCTNAIKQLRAFVLHPSAEQTLATACGCALPSHDIRPELPFDPDIADGAKERRELLRSDVSLECVVSVGVIRTGPGRFEIGHTWIHNGNGPSP